MQTAEEARAIAVNKEIARQLREIAELETNKWKRKTFLEAAANIELRTKPITSGFQASQEIEKVGEGIARRIDDILATGEISELQRLDPSSRRRLDSVAIFKKIEGVNKITADKWYEEGYRTLQDLQSKYPTMTHAQQIGYYFFNDLQLKIPRAEMDKIDQFFHSILDNVQGIGRLNFVMAGSYRRGALQSGDVDLLVENPGTYMDGATIIEIVVSLMQQYGFVVSLLAKGKSKFRGVVRLPLTPEQRAAGQPENPVRKMDMRAIMTKSWPFGLLYFTGSKGFNIASRNRAISMGLKLSEYSLQDMAGNDYPPGKPIRTEQDIFEALGIKYIEPVNRTDDVVLISLTEAPALSGSRLEIQKFTGQWVRPVNSLLVYITTGIDRFIRNPAAIASFDLDGTLVGYPGGAHFGKPLSELQVLPGRLNKLSMLVQQGYTLVIFTNQKSQSDAVMQKNFDKVVHALFLLNIPVIVFMATGDDEFRKPKTGMWKQLSAVIPNIDWRSTFFCGDAAGRPGDHADSDLMFAKNQNVTFYTPEQLFGQ